MEGAVTLRFTTQAQSDIRRITRDLADLQAQLSSGTKARDLGGFSGESTRLLSAKGMQAALDARRAVMSQFEGRFDLQMLALNQGASSARGLAQTIREALASNDGRGIASELQFAFEGVAQAMNETWGGQPLFAGERQTGTPIKVGSLDALAAATGPDDIFDESERHAVVDIGLGSPIELAGKASEISGGLMDTMRSLKQLMNFAGGSIGQPIDPSMVSQLSAIAARLDSEAQTLTNEEGRTGRLQARFDLERERVTQQTDLLSKEIGNQADADLAQVSIKLNTLMAQYEATAKSFSDLSKLSLLNYL
jgi:flagellar hook-associated protein 3 FlgL